MQAGPPSLRPVRLLALPDDDNHTNDDPMRAISTQGKLPLVQPRVSYVFLVANLSVYAAGIVLAFTQGNEASNDFFLLLAKVNSEVLPCQQCCMLKLAPHKALCRIVATDTGDVASTSCHHSYPASLAVTEHVTRHLQHPSTSSSRRSLQSWS